MIEKVEDIKRPLIVGEALNVLCAISIFESEERITPIINHPHSDKENGQDEVHFHADSRFIYRKNKGHLAKYGIAIGNRNFKQLGSIRLKINEIVRFERVNLKVQKIKETLETDISFISKSKLKHKCIKNGKCPHRGYDLSQVEPTPEGVLICPLHSLKFNSITKQLIKNEISINTH